MTRDGNQYDSDLLDLVQQGANFSCIAQHPNGSWGYVPGRPGDVTITGWQVLSLIGSRKGVQHFTPIRYLMRKASS